MSEKYKFMDPGGHYFVTMSIVYWIDLFTRKDYKFMIVDSLNYCIKQKGLVVNAWCLMPSHLHMIVRTQDKPLPEIMRDFKKFTSKQIIELIERINESRKDWLLREFKRAGQNLKRISKHKVWQDGNHPQLLMTGPFFNQKLNYIHNNPVTDCIVDAPEEYLYSSARDYAGRKGLVTVEFVD